MQSPADCPHSALFSRRTFSDRDAQFRRIAFTLLVPPMSVQKLNSSKLTRQTTLNHPGSTCPPQSSNPHKLSAFAQFPCSQIFACLPPSRTQNGQHCKLGASTGRHSAATQTRYRPMLTEDCLPNIVHDVRSVFLEHFYLSQPPNSRLSE